DFQDWLLHKLSDTAGETPGVDFAKDVQPWLGKRVAVAAVPDGDSADGLVVIQETDDAAAEAGLRKLSQASHDTSDWVVRDGWAVVSSGRRGSAAAALAAAEKAPLAQLQTFRADVESLHSDQVVTAWADLGRS